MNGCTRRIPTSTLLDYWFGEAAADEAAVEEHLMGCRYCSSRLRALAQVGDGIRHAARAGQVHAVLSPAFVEQLRADGLRLREYRLQPGGSVACTVAPDDDLVISHLHASLRDVQRLDLVLEDLTTGMTLRMPDLAFDPAQDEVTIAPNTAALRALEASTHRMRLLAVQGDSERELGAYTFHHSRS